MNKQQIIQASRLHKKSLSQAKKAAITLGWLPEFVEDVANLDYSVMYLQRLNSRGECSKRQLNAILAVMDASKFEVLTLFADSQV